MSGSQASSSSGLMGVREACRRRRPFLGEAQELAEGSRELCFPSHLGRSTRDSPGSNRPPWTSRPMTWDPHTPEWGRIQLFTDKDRNLGPEGHPELFSHLWAMLWAHRGLQRILAGADFSLVLCDPTTARALVRGVGTVRAEKKPEGRYPQPLDQ